MRQREEVQAVLRDGLRRRRRTVLRTNRSIGVHLVLALASACRPAPAPNASVSVGPAPAGSGARSGSAGSGARSERACAVEAEPEPTALAPHPETDEPGVLLRLPSGLWKGGLYGHLLKEPPSNPKVWSNLMMDPLLLDCGESIELMAVGIIDDEPEQPLKTFAVAALRDQLLLRAEHVQFVVGEERTFIAVVHQTSGNAPRSAWVAFQRPDWSCKTFFVAIVDRPERIASLGIVFSEVVHSMQPVRMEWMCTSGGTGGGFG